MSALTINRGINPAAPQSLINQGFFNGSSNSANPSGGSLTRRGRLARSLVVLSLTVLMVAGFAAKSGAGQIQPTGASSYTVVVVAPGETLWSIAAAFASGDVQGMVNEIRESNNLKGVDLQAGQKIRVPIQ